MIETAVVSLQQLRCLLELIQLFPRQYIEDEPLEELLRVVTLIDWTVSAKCDGVFDEYYICLVTHLKCQLVKL